MKDRQSISEAEYERLADARIMRRLQSDYRYVYAENAEEQAEAEATIEKEIFAGLDLRYRII